MGRCSVDRNLAARGIYWRAMDKWVDSGGPQDVSVVYSVLDICCGMREVSAVNIL